MKTPVNTANLEIKILYRDNAFMAVDKPPGIPTYQDGGAESEPKGCKEILEDQLNQRLFPIHRIDSDTSGIVLFALDSRSAAAFIELFKEHQVKKSYLVWCVGDIAETGSIRNPLKKNKSKDMEPARTDFVRVKSRAGFSLVRVSPYTGRFHQIRRHLDSIGHTIVGDPKYGKPQSWKAFFKVSASKSESDSRGRPRLMLHAESIEFIHPLKGRLMRLGCSAEGAEW